MAGPKPIMNHEEEYNLVCVHSNCPRFLHSGILRQLPMKSLANYI